MREATKKRPRILEAAFIRHFGIYTKWPSQTFHSGTSPVTACFVGNDQRRVGQTLQRAALNPAFKIGKRRLEVQELGELNESTIKSIATRIEKCQILFVTNVRIKDWARLYEIIKKDSVLTIGDTNGFAENDGMIELYLSGSGRQYRFKVNLKNIRRVNLDLDSALLALSVIEVIDL